MILTEYLKLLPRGLKNADKIIEGLINETKSLYNGLTEEEHNEIVKRRLICQSCPFHSLNATTSKEYLDLFGEHYQSDRKDEHCSVCGCNEKVKTSSLSSDCGLVIYNEKNPENIQELKWTKFNNKQ
jgi:hypothetical protein